MKKADELRNLIFQLEVKKQVLEDELKNEVKDTLYNLQPMQLIKNGFSQLTGKNVSNNIVGASIAVASGQVVRKILVRKNSGFIRRFIVNTLQRIVEYGILKKLKKFPEEPNH